MKLIPFVVAGALANQSTFTADPNDAMNQLSMLMAGSQMALGKAQRHHQKLVDKTRKVVVKNFDDEAEEFGSQIGKYAVSLKKAELVLAGAIDAASAGLKEEEKAPAKADDWEDPGVAERARLAAQMNAANRTLQHMSRAHERAVHEAEDDASQAFEDAGMKLSMKLGDLSDASDGAKKQLVEKADRVQAGFVAGKSQMLKGVGNSQQARLQWYEKAVKDAQKSSTDAGAKSKKAFSTFLAKDTAQVESASSTVLADLAAAQKKEIVRVLNHQPTLAPFKRKPDAAAEKRAAQHKQHQIDKVKTVRK